MKKTKSLVLIMLGVMLLLLTPRTVKADSNDDYWAKRGLNAIDKTLYYSNHTTGYFYGYLKSPKTKNIKVKSSNPSVCNATLEKGSSGNYIKIQLLEPGKATLQLSYTYKGKKYSSKARVKCVNYTNPFKSFKIKGKEYKSTFNRSNITLSAADSYYYAYKKVSGKGAITVKMAKGFSLLGRGSCRTHFKNGSCPIFKSGQSINLSNLEFIDFRYKDSEGYITTAFYENRKR